MKKVFSFALFCLFSCPTFALSQSTQKLGGLHTQVAIEVSAPTKDAELIGINQELLEEALRKSLKKFNISALPSTVKKASAMLSLRTITIDVAPRITTHIQLRLLEVAKLDRMINRRFVITWDHGKMVVGNALKHPEQIKDAIKDLVATYVNASLE